MNERREKLPLGALLAAIALLLCGQFFFLGLNVSALYQEYQKTSKTVESIFINDLGRRLDTLARLNLKLGRQLAVLETMRQIADLSRAKYFMVTDAEGRVMAGTAPAAEVRVPAERRAFSGPVSEFTAGGLLWLARPVLARDGGRPVGYVLLALDEGRYTSAVTEIMKRYRLPLIASSVLSVALLIFVFLRYQKKARKSSGRGRYLIFLGPFLLSQLAFYAIVFEPRQELYYAQNQGVARQVGRSLAADLERLSSRNVPFEIVPNISRHLEDLRENLGVIGGLALVDPRGRLLGSASENGPLEAGRHYAFLAGLSPSLKFTLPISGGAGDIEIWLSPRSLRRSTLSVMIDSLTMTLVASLLLVELARLLFMRSGAAGGRLWTENPKAMRPFAFICLFAMDMSMSFIPLKMAEISPVFMGLPESMVLGLPISAEMLMVGLATVAGGFLVHRLVNWRFLFLAGLLLMALGYVLSGQAGSAGFYILARALAGLGYGLLNLGASIFVITKSGVQEKGEAMGEFTAGLFAGSLCGCAAGGLMADRLGFAPVFYAAAAILLLVFVLSLFSFPNSRHDAPKGEDAGPEKLNLKALLGFTVNGQVVNMGLFQVLPVAIVSVGLMNYFLPIYMGSLGAGPAAVGQLNVVYSLVIVFIGPVFGRLIDVSRRKFFYLALGGLFAALTLPSFLMIPALGGVLAAVIFLGLSNAISENGHPAYLLGLPASRKLGVGPSISLYTSLIRVGQVLGPLVIAAALNRGGLGSLVWLGGTLIFLNLVFILRASKEGSA